MEFDDRVSAGRAPTHQGGRYLSLLLCTFLAIWKGLLSLRSVKRNVVSGRHIISILASIEQVNPEQHPQRTIFLLEVYVALIHSQYRYSDLFSPSVERALCF